MKRSRLTEEQIIAILREQEAGVAVTELCRKHGISSPTFYKWKAKFSGTDVSKARRLKALEEENGRLKRMLADAMLANVALKDLLRKSGDARRIGGCAAPAVGPRDERAAGMPGVGRRPDERSLPGDPAGEYGAARAAAGAGAGRAAVRRSTAARAASP